jgi:type II secretory pathway component PulK
LKTQLHNRAPRAAFALILVMITIIALTTLVASFALSMSTEVRLAQNADYDLELEWMGRAGIEMARWALANKCPEQKGMDALNQFWAGGTAPCSNEVPQISLKNVPMGRGHFSVSISDMERKWDINLVANSRPPQTEVLQKALVEVGLTDAGLSSTIVDSILDWCSPSATTTRLSGAKDDFYGRLKPPYYCKNGNVDDLSELLLIRGISPDIYWGSYSTNHPMSAYQEHGGGAFGQPATAAGPHFRNSDQPVYPVGLQELFSPLGGPLNVNTASLKTLQLIPGLDAAAAQQIINQRAGPDGIDGTYDDAPFQNIGEINGLNVQGAAQVGPATQNLSAFIGVRSRVFEVRVDAEINGYKRRFYGIVSRAGATGQQIKCVKFYWD